LCACTAHPHCIRVLLLRLFCKKKCTITFYGYILQCLLTEYVRGETLPSCILHTATRCNTLQHTSERTLPMSPGQYQAISQGARKNNRERASGAHAHKHTRTHARTHAQAHKHQHTHTYTHIQVAPSSCSLCVCLSPLLSLSLAPPYRGGFPIIGSIDKVVSILQRVAIYCNVLQCATHIFAIWLPRIAASLF